MSRPAEKERDIAHVLGIPVAEVPARLRRVYEAVESVRDVADWLTRRGVPTSKSQVHRIIHGEEDPS
jgi:hypothetical protein